MYATDTFEFEQFQQWRSRANPRLNRLISLRELKQMVQCEGTDGAALILQESLDRGELRPENFSVQDLFVALHESGEELLRSISRRKSGDRSLLEAADAVSTTQFSSIIGQIIYNRIRDAYQDPVFLWPELCETQTTEFLDGERIPGVGRIGDKAEVVDEGMAYPLVGLNEEWLQTDPTRKRGFIVPVTREIIIADRTGIMLKIAAETGYWLGVNKEKRVLDVVTGQKNNYNRNGTYTNTYLTSGAYINSQTGNALDAAGNEWRALEKADLLFDAMTDPNTGEPVIVIPDTIVAPSALKKTALRILSATQVEHVDMRSNTATIRSTSPNPYGGRDIKVCSSPYVKYRSGSATKWYYGCPKKAFLYMEVWDIETVQAASGHPDEFGRDIWQQHKVSERGVAQAYEARFMTQNDQ